MNVNQVKEGLRVQTNNELGKSGGMSVAQKHLEARAPSTEGTVRGCVPGHGGDVWWVEHSNGAVGAYCFDEFSPLKDASMPNGREEAKE